MNRVIDRLQLTSQKSSEAFFPLLRSNITAYNIETQADNHAESERARLRRERAEARAHTQSNLPHDPNFDIPSYDDYEQEQPKNKKLWTALGYLSVLRITISDRKLYRQIRKHAESERARLRQVVHVPNTYGPFDLPSDPNEPLFLPEDDIDRITTDDIAKIKSLVESSTEQTAASSEQVLR